MNQDFPCYNSSSLDQYQPPQYPVVHKPSEENGITEIIEEHYKGVQTMMLKMSEIHRQKQAEQRKEEKRSAEEQAAQNSPIAIASDSPITNSLITEDEHLDTIPKTESDELIKSSIEDLVQTPSEFEDLSDYVSEYDLPFCYNSPDFNNDSEVFSNPLFDSNDDYTSSDDESLSEDVPKENFKIYSNPLFDEEIISTKIDPHHFNAESDLIESFCNKDTVITSTKIDFLLEEFAGELALINPIPSGIAETNFDPKEDIRLIKKLLYDNSSPRPPKELNSEISDAMIESFSSSSIPMKDSDSLMEEIDIFLVTDDSIPPGIDSDGYDSEEDNLFLEYEPDLGELTRVVVEDIFGEPRVHMPNVLPTHPTICQDMDFTLSTDFSGSDLVVSFPSGIRNKTFDPRISIEVQSTDLKPKNDYPDYEDSRARSFFQRSLGLHSFVCLFWESYILDLID
ncbi:hypothetical protein Tco_1110836 [Tanacetum coccineum]|uniref:Reverse transcriptase domain-containing protein n=1 Tax=Tanacetum coccineum TaxID=301880 RepID=A0ABQ5IM24_9ASTR